jgi:hypothetical protein
VIACTQQTAVKWALYALLALTTVGFLSLCVWVFVRFREEGNRPPTPSPANFANFGALPPGERIALLQKTRQEIVDLAGRRKGLNRLAEDDLLIAPILAVPASGYPEVEARAELFRLLRPLDPRPVVAFCHTHFGSEVIFYTLTCYLELDKEAQPELIATISPSMFAFADRLTHPPLYGFAGCFCIVAHAHPVEGSRAYCRLLDVCDRQPYPNIDALLFSIDFSGLRDETILARLRAFKTKYPPGTNTWKMIEFIETNSR